MTRVGSRGWRYNPSRNVYHVGDRTGRPSERARWVETFVVGETPRSWYLASAPDVPADHHSVVKVAKNKVEILFDAASVEQHIWAAAERHRLSDRVRSLDPAVLAQVAALLGEPLPGEPGPDGPWLISHCDTKGFKNSQGEAVGADGRPL